MNMYNASFKTEQNYIITIIDNATKKNPFKNSVYYNNCLKIYTGKKNENTSFTKKLLLLL